jgi:methanogenic corrinoid protein MtbC1
MLSWCAYCYKFIEELPSYNDMSVTHGLCLNCRVNFRQIVNSPKERLKNLTNLSQVIWQAGRSGDVSQISAILQSAHSIGVRRQDLVVGLLSPMLVEIGRLWEIGELTVQEEHRFSFFADQILTEIRLDTSSEQSLRDAQKERLEQNWVLFPVEGNTHTFGLKVIQLILETNQIRPQLILPNCSPQKMREYILNHKARCLGVSVALADQEKSLYELLNILSSLKSQEMPRIFIGGRAVTAGLISSLNGSGAIFVKNASELHSFIND